MKNVKSMVRAGLMMSVITFATTFAHAGIIIAKRGDSEPCKSTTERGVLDQMGGVVLEGIIIAKTGIIIAKVGIIIAKDEATTCDPEPSKVGIIIA